MTLIHCRENYLKGYWIGNNKKISLCLIFLFLLEVVDYKGPESANTRSIKKIVVITKIGPIQNGIKFDSSQQLLTRTWLGR